MLRRLALWAQPIVLRSQAGRLRPVWAALYVGIARAVAAYMSRGTASSAAYLCRSVAAGDAVYGMSDIDMVIVVPGRSGDRGGEHRRLLRRWERLRRMVPGLGTVLLPDLAIYEDAELREAIASSVLTYGLRPEERDRAAFFGARPPADDFGLRTRPGVLGPMGDWSLLRGRDRRPPAPARDRQQRRIGAWLELQFLWSFAFRACADPGAHWVPLLCVKLISEPARIWLSLVEGEDVRGRRATLERAIPALPEHEDSLREALSLERALPEASRSRLESAIPAFVALTSRIAGRLSEEVAGAATTGVRLSWGNASELALPGDAGNKELLPLADWRARSIPSLLDEALDPTTGDPSDHSLLARAAFAGSAGAYPALRAGGVLVLPALGVWTRSFLRAVQCAETDPVSFALLAGRDEAIFPEVAGWSAGDAAERAVAEHRAWLEAPTDRLTAREWFDPGAHEVDPSLRQLAKLFTAARAALFLESIRSGDPELALTGKAVAELLSGRNGESVAEEAWGSYRDGLRGGPTPATATVAAMRRLVLELPGFGGLPERPRPREAKRPRRRSVRR